MVGSLLLLYLNTLAKGIYTFTTGQKTLIDDIAAQCPFIGGTSVYTARAIQNLYNPQEYDDEAICAAAAERSEALAETFEGPNTVLVYPNPAKDELNIQFTQSLESDSHLRVFDLTGKQVLVQKLPAGMELYQVESALMSAGIYFYRIEDGSKHTISSGKVVISR